MSISSQSAAKRSGEVKNYWSRLDVKKQAALLFIGALLIGCILVYILNAYIAHK